MISVHEDSKYVYVWGLQECADADTINKYVEMGYKIIRFNNGSESIRDCMKTIIKSYNQL